jgi:RHS repeat-associated protein
VSNKSGVAQNVISLPKGGGALKGIGETFAPDLHTGTGNFTVPIQLLPGRSGFQPKIDLVYSTGNGNGPFGLGWSMSLPGIARQTSKGVPRYRDFDPDLLKRDTFVLAGSEDLVPVEAVADEPARKVVRYRPRTEGIFAKILRHYEPSASRDYWEVLSTDGLVSYYGTNPTPDEHPILDPSPLRDPGVIFKGPHETRAELKHIFAWKLTLTKDTFGNRIEYLYTERDQSTAADEREGHRWDQPLLKQIRYVDYGDPSRRRFLVYVTLEYENRPDHFSEFRSGFDLRTTKRCKAIHIETRPVSNETERIIKSRSYEFKYRNDSLNGTSLLAAVDVAGFDDDGQEIRELPRLDFGYTSFEPDQHRDFFPVTGPDLPAGSLGRPEYELADLTANGLPDVLEMNGAVRYWRNLGGGRFDLPRQMRDAPPVALADPGVQMIDADGDGRIDLMVTNGSLNGYFPLNQDAGWDRQSFRRYQFSPSFSLDDTEVKLIDLNGDGITDAIRSGSRLECFFNDPEEGWLADNSRFVVRAALDLFPKVNFSDSRVKFGDMSGDGLQDIVLIHDGNVEYWPNLGWGDWGRRIHMHKSPRFPYNYDAKRILLGDVDGDGLADIIYVDDRQITLWINQSGNRWSDPIEIHGTPPVSDVDSVRLADLQGSGISGVLWSADASHSARNQLHFLDLTGGGKPYLLREIDSHLGASTKVNYASSTECYLEDELRAGTRWQTTLPFPVQVVKRVEVVDHLSQTKLTTEFKYHHGYWDGAEREFRGFGMVEQLDTETKLEFNGPGLHKSGPEVSVSDQHFSPPVLTKTWFYQGPIGPEHGDWHEADYRDEYWPGDPPAFDRSATITSLFESNPSSRRIKRDALRALRGVVLRTEMYALDDSVREDRPYTVTESQHGVKEIEPPTETLRGRRRVFFPHQLVQRTTQWERGDDPMTQVVLTDDYDDFGQSREQTTIALPRREAKRVAIANGVNPNETRILCTYTVTEYVEPADRTVYIHDRVCQTRIFELKNPPTVSESEKQDIVRVLADQVAAAFQVREAFRSALQSWTAGQPLPEALRVVGHTLNHYDGPAFDGLRVSEIGKYGALSRTETLVFTDEILDTAYEGRRPFYLGGAADLPANAPANFGDSVGYRREQDSVLGYHSGYYADSLRQAFDSQSSGVALVKGLVVATEDSLRNRTSIAHDTFLFMPTLVIDPARLETKAEYNYRLFQPRKVIDPNENVSEFEFSPLGLPSQIWLKGKLTLREGDRERSCSQFVYDFRTFELSQQPIVVRTIRNLHHDTETTVALAERHEIMEIREYSDGFGRLLQTRKQAESLFFGDSGFGNSVVPLAQGDPADRSPVTGSRNSGPDQNVVVSGWQLYDNKGRVIEKYEPFFDRGWDYRRPTQSHLDRSQKVVMSYDPRGQLIRSLNPDGTQQRVILGTPHDPLHLVLEQNDLVSFRMPDRFEPTPWETYTYDANDLAKLSLDADGETLASRAPTDHHFTPASAMFDGLGRVICQVTRNGSNPDAEWFMTRSGYDCRGNLLDIFDPLGRRAFAHAYDLLNRALRVNSIADAGLRTSVPDAAGNVREYRDGKGSLVLRQYDVLNRLTHLWARNEPTARFTLRERIIYGDDGDHSLARQSNKLGKAAEHYDEAGVQRFTRYDFKGNLTDKVRFTISDLALANAWIADWAQANAEQALDPTGYETSTRYDGLNRPTAVLYPADVNGDRATLRPLYNRGGALERVDLDGTAYVEHIAYNARGQRILISYGNKLMTRYAYDPHTFRLVRLRTEAILGLGSTGDSITIQPGGDVLQDFRYTYDLAGNITAIDDRVHNCGIEGGEFGRDRLLRQFEYDPLYRLIKADGRECKDIGIPRPLRDLPRCGFYPGRPSTPTQENAPDLTEHYEETYAYDPAGNLLELTHHGGGNSWRRAFGMGGLSPNDWALAANNRLSSLTNGSRTHLYQFDGSGNLIQQNTERQFSWDHADRMVGFTIRPQNSTQASVEARYLYGADGVRAKKWVRKNGNGSSAESTVYIDTIFEHHRWSENRTQKENNRIHVMDNQSRIAVIRIGDIRPGDGGERVQYQFGDHLGSSSVVVGGSTATATSFVNREEYFSYGETSFGCFAKKRYRYSGKERDEESGFYYFGARYYAAGMARWVSCDPAVLEARFYPEPRRNRLCQASNLYAAYSANPIGYVDPDGRRPVSVAEQRVIAEEVNNIAIDTFKQVVASPEAEAMRKTMSAKQYPFWLGKNVEQVIIERLGNAHGLRPNVNLNDAATELDIVFPDKKLIVELKLSENALKWDQTLKHMKVAEAQGFAYAVSFASGKHKPYFLSARTIATIAKGITGSKYLARAFSVLALVQFARRLDDYHEGKITGEKLLEDTALETVQGQVFNEIRERAPDTIRESAPAMAETFFSGTDIDIVEILRQPLAGSKSR